MSVCVHMPFLSPFSSVCCCLCITHLKTCTDWKHSVIGWQTWPLSLLSFISLIRSLIYSCRSAAAISQIQLLIKCLSYMPFVHGAACLHSLICPSHHPVLLLLHLAGELKLCILLWYCALILYLHSFVSKRTPRWMWLDWSIKWDHRPCKWNRLCGSSVKSLA